MWPESLTAGGLIHVSDPGVIGAPSPTESLFLCWLAPSSAQPSARRLLELFKTIYNRQNEIGALTTNSFCLENFGN
jgi:transcriptional regulator GlxA family with amidase domain